MGTPNVLRARPPELLIIDSKAGGLTKKCALCLCAAGADPVLTTRLGPFGFSCRLVAVEVKKSEHCPIMGTPNGSLWEQLGDDEEDEVAEQLVVVSWLSTRKRGGLTKNPGPPVASL